MLGNKLMASTSRRIEDAANPADRGFVNRRFRVRDPGSAPRYPKQIARFGLVSEPGDLVCSNICNNASESGS